MPAWPCVAMSVSPAMSPPILRSTSCTARPIVALARAPWPNTLPRALMSSLSDDRAVDDEKRRGGVGRGLDAVELAVVVEQRVDRRKHDREIVRLASGHHRIDGDLFDGGVAPARRNRSDLFRWRRGPRPRSWRRPYWRSETRPASRRSSRARTAFPGRHCRWRRRTGQRALAAAALFASRVSRSTSASSAASARSVTALCGAVCIGCGIFTSGRFRHAATGGLFARGVGKGRAEHGDGRNAAPLDLDGVGDVDRSRGAAIAEAQNHGVALRQARQIGLAQTILRRELAHDRTGHDGVTIAELMAQARMKRSALHLLLSTKPTRLPRRSVRRLAPAMSAAGRRRSVPTDPAPSPLSPCGYGYYWIQYNPQIYRRSNPNSRPRRRGRSSRPT